MAVTLKKENEKQEKPGAYQSAWQSQSQAVTDKIMNREGFSYDMEKDPLYQQYKQQYTQQGLTAMQDTIGKAAALTGGYGNSYAAAAGQQAYQSYLQQLNAVVPDLYDLAMQQYRMEEDNLYRQADYLDRMEQTDYDRYLDSYNQWVDDRDYAYQQSRDQAADAKWREQFDYNKSIDARDYAYQQSRDQVEDSYRQAQFAEDIRRYDQDYAYQQSRDQVNDSYRQAQFNEDIRRYDQEYAYQQSRDQVADTRWQTEFDEDVRRYNQQYAGKTDTTSSKTGTTGSTSSSSGYDTSTIKQVQNALGVTVDGVWGPKSEKALKEKGYTSLADAVNRITNGYGTAIGECRMMIRNGAPKSEISAYLKDEYQAGHITEAEWKELTQIYAGKGNTY